ncbi:non-ribosomal peptide synthetase [Ktedonosporobacter rubrisoli]|nr:non-ribosomal peptide synthetase [Ktedonosporobacter rubrisoli]
MQASNVEDIYELSPMQQGILYHTLYAQKASIYVVQFCYRLHGELDTFQFKLAWRKIVERHAILRTSIYWKELDKPLQVVRLRVSLPWEEEDWRFLSSAEQQTHLQALLQQDQTCRFDLTQAPLMRFKLVRTANEAYYFVWCSHHIILDGWSAALVMGEVWETYHAALQMRIAHLPSVRPYGDYIGWLQLRDEAGAESFWRRFLKRFQVPTPLPIEHIEDAAGGERSQGGAEEVHLSASDSATLYAFAKRNHITLGTLLQATWALLLSHYSGERDVVFGLVSSGRPLTLAGSEAMVGLFINTLPLRVQIDPDTTALLWLKQLQERVGEMLQYEYASLVQIQNWSEVPRGQSLFQSILVIENYPKESGWNQTDALSIETLQTAEQTNYPLTAIGIADQQITLEIKYDRARFERLAIKRMLGHWQTLLTHLIDNVDQHPLEVALLTEAERLQIIEEWNRTSIDYPQALCLHHLFESQALRSPDSIALVYKEEHISYQALNERADYLANVLTKEGAGPETLIGVYLGRSSELIIALLAILKAGAAYLPLDPTYPQKRLSFMLADAHVSMVLTQERYCASLPTGSFRIICLEREWGKAVGALCTPQPALSGENAAYVIYTSGSTGQPKGVVVPHRSLVHHTFAINEKYALGPGDRVLQFASISFDVAAEEIFATLSKGATLILKPEQETSQLQDFLIWVQRLRLTVLNLPTPYWHEWMRAVESGTRLLPQALRLVVVGSDTTLTKPLTTWQQYTQGRIRLFHAYGTTETTITATIYDLQNKEPSLASPTIPIGRPIANTSIYILDNLLHPVPQGILRELYIGGLGVAQCYLNRPELTAENFIPDPFGQRNGALLYRTGDQARYLADGVIEFLGRRDSQVKLRGYRVEPGEVEVALNQHSLVRSAAVVAQEESSGHRSLAAYVVPDTSVQCDPSSAEALEFSLQLRRYLQEKLPSYMLPASINLQRRLPLTTNGKIDRKALVAYPRLPPQTASTEYIAPSTPLERLSASIWQEILGVEKIGINDNFFELGGHSLLIMQFHSKLQQALNREVSLIDFFRNPTIRALTASLEQKQEILREVEQAGEQEERISRGKGRLRQRMENRRRPVER